MPILSSYDIQVAQLVHESRMLQARARGQSGRSALDDALARVESALRLSPADREALQQLARVRFARREYPEAERALRSFLDIKPSADVCVMLAQALLASGRPAEAESMLDAAQELEPDHGGVFIVRGDAHLARGRIDQAIVAYREALRVDPNRSSGSAGRKLQAALAAKAAATHR